MLIQEGHCAKIDIRSHILKESHWRKRLESVGYVLNEYCLLLYDLFDTNNEPFVSRGMIRLFLFSENIELQPVESHRLTGRSLQPLLTVATAVATPLTAPLLRKADSLLREIAKRL